MESGHSIPRKQKLPEISLKLNFIQKLVLFPRHQTVHQICVICTLVIYIVLYKDQNIEKKKPFRKTRIGRVKQLHTLN